MTALANHAGGLLLVGVEEKDGAAAAAVATVPDAEGEVQRLRRALVNHAEPVPRVEFVSVPSSDGGHYLAVVVPPSPLAPHAVAPPRGDSRRPLHWFVRDGADTRPLGEAELAERYRARFRGAEDHRARRDRAAADGRETLGRSPLLWLWTASVPHAPVPAVLDAQAVLDAEEWWQRQYRFVSPFTRFLRAGGPAIAGPGRTTFTGAAYRKEHDEADPRDAYIELHADGTAFAATPVETNTGDDGGIGAVTLADDMILIVNLCLSWTLRQTGAWGSADLLSGLRDGRVPDGQLSAPMALVDYASGGSRRLPATRLVHRPPSATTTVDLASADSVQGRLAASSRAAAGVLQWFGVPEPAQVAPDGTVRTDEWETLTSREVAVWAAEHGVPSTARA